MSQEEINFSDFMASSVHDMKNSLNMQIGSLEKIAAKCREQGDTNTFEQFGLMIYEANRMNANLVQLLTLYKFGNSIYPMDVEEYPVREVIEEALMQDKSIMELKGMSITVDCDESLYWYFDRDLVTGILINALNNAYKYTNDKIRIEAKVDGAFLVIRVEDNGRGYPPNMLINDSVTENRGVNFTSSSTGLGFYFSSRVAAMHKNGDAKGSLIIENGGAYGGGCFVVRLP